MQEEDVDIIMHHVLGVIDSLRRCYTSLYMHVLMACRAVLISIQLFSLSGQLCEVVFQFSPINVAGIG